MALRHSFARRASLGIALLIIMGSCGGDDAVSGRPSPSPDGGTVAQVPALRVFVGNIHTLVGDADTVEALAVDNRGQITAVGRRSDVLARTADARPEIVTLGARQALLPGFIDAHMHLSGLVQTMARPLKQVGACLPKPFRGLEDVACYATIEDGLAALAAHGPLAKGNPLSWYVGLDLDPSRQPLNLGTPSSVFRTSPKTAMAKISATRPALVLDQSGHLAYVNEAALERIKGILTLRRAWPPRFVDGGQLELVSPSADPKLASSYTGVVLEQEAIGLVFELALLESPLALAEFANMAEYIRNGKPGTLATSRALRAAGLTTIVNIADSKADLEAAKEFTERADTPVRVSTLIRVEAIARDKLSADPRLPACDHAQDPRCAPMKDLGVTGIKLTADGSTQGCSAAMASAYRGGGYCERAGAGRANFTEDQIVEALRPYWRRGTWRFETHTNGDGVMASVANAYARLQQESVNPHPAVLIHATVGDPTLLASLADLRAGRYQVGGKPVPAVDVRMTHLIGHVAYWGNSFIDILGPERAANIDATGTERKLGIPFSLHSDATVTPQQPLWQVQQAVTRRTWVYPELTQSLVLGPEHKLTIREALRAITIDAAREKELDRWLGSLEVGKAADMVLLDIDPLAPGFDPETLASVPVVTTYLGGVAR